MLTFVRDLRFAVRHLRRTPGFALLGVLLFALGIGAATAMFSVVEGVLLRPLPFPQPDRLVSLTDTVDRSNLRRGGPVGVTSVDIRNYTRETHSFSSLGGYLLHSMELSGSVRPEQITVARMTAGVFPALALQPVLGRVFTQQEDELRAPVAVLSYALWQSRFDGATNIVGTTILLDRQPCVVIGVMPRSFEFPLGAGRENRSALWIPMSLSPVDYGFASAFGYSMVGRLKPGVTPAQAQEDAERVAEETTRNFPGWMAGIRIHAVVAPLKEATVHETRPLLRTLFLAVGAVLLIACANLAGLLLVRAVRRRRELAVRLALGADAARLLRESGLESVVLATAGGLLGIGLAALAVRFGLPHFPDSLPRMDGIRLDGTVVIFALGLSLVTGILCGVAPAWLALRTGVHDALRRRSTTSSGSGSDARLRSVLVVAEIAAAMVLVTAAGLLLRSFEKMRDVDLGFRPDHVLVAGFSLPAQQYGTQQAVDQFHDELLRRVHRLPGVSEEGITSWLAANGSGNNQAYTAAAAAPQSGGNLTVAAYSTVRGDYFRAMGVSLLRGRFFTAGDGPRSPLVVIINHKLAQEAWPGENPIGKRIHMGSRNLHLPWMKVIGEVGDVKLGAPDSPDRAEIFQALGQHELAYGFQSSPKDVIGASGYIVIRSRTEPELTENALRATVRSIDPELPLTHVQSLEQAVSTSELPRRFGTALISAFAAAALLLALLGIYTVIAFSVAQRTQEVAIRIALGSRRSEILGLVLGSGVRLGLAGSLLGLAGALAFSHLLRAFLFGVEPFDPTVLGLGAGLVLLVAVAASSLPALRAASIEPVEALREE